MKKIVVLLVVLLGCMPVTAFAQKQFFFKDGRFVVAQFTDLHWMPGSAKCAETAATIRAVLAAEHPDIAILSGDVVTDDPAMDGWKSVVDIFNEAKMPFVVMMGNHDAESGNLRGCNNDHYIVAECSYYNAGNLAGTCHYCTGSLGAAEKYDSCTGSYTNRPGNRKF